MLVPMSALIDLISTIFRNSKDVTFLFENILATLRHIILDPAGSHR